MIRDLSAVLPLVASDDHLRHPQSSGNSTGDAADSSESRARYNHYERQREDFT